MEDNEESLTKDKSICSNDEEQQDEITPLLRDVPSTSSSFKLTGAPPKRKSKLFRGISLSSQLARLSEDENTIQEHSNKTAPPINSTLIQLSMKSH